MRALALPIAAALGLSGCVPLLSTGGTIDTAIASSLPQTCRLLEVAHAAFTAASASGNIPARTVARELAAYDGVVVICADPSRVTAANALVVVATAYATVSLALREAKNHD